MKLNFVKMHACGNDYIYLDAIAHPLPPHVQQWLPAYIPAMCHRHYGIGADGVVVLDATDTGYTMTMFNADGTLGATCGNALRCVAYLLHRIHGLPMAQTVHTAVGPVQVDNAADGYRVAMHDAHIVAQRTLRMQGQCYDYTVVDVGNRHAVVHRCNLPIEAVHTAVCRRLGQDCNVETYAMVKDRLYMQVCERGSGVTLGCGSGACAVAYAAVQRGLLDWPVCVHTAGGRVCVDWQDGRVMLSGEAVYVYKGVYAIADEF